MARTTYAVDTPGQSVSGGAVTKRTGDNVNGHYVANSGRTKVLLVNTAASPATVYFWPGGHPNGAAGAVATGATQVAGNATFKGAPVQVLSVALAAAGSAGDAKVCGPFAQADWSANLYFDPTASTVNFYAFED